MHPEPCACRKSHPHHATWAHSSMTPLRRSRRLTTESVSPFEPGAADDRTDRRRHGRHRGTCVMVVSFMSWFPALQGRPLVGGLTPLLRTPPPRSGTASQIFLPNSMESLTPSSYRLISRRRPWPCIRRRPPAGH